MGEDQNLLDAYLDIHNSVNKLSQDVSKINDDEYYRIERGVKALEVKRLFTGKWDAGNAIISIYAGAGGQDAADWVHMLYQMYEKYAQNQKWTVNIIDSTEEEYQSKTGRRPLKNITFEVKGKYSFGYLKKENGVHRLVRISPFSPQSLRHTSFALVEVLPEVKEHTLEIRPDDLKVEFFRSSGPGGQNVNKVETAVRIVHVPTGLVASSQVERSQSQNRDKAMAVLEAKLIQLMEKERVDELSKLRNRSKPEWGNQIRSYVLNPYQLIKDHRTDYETSKINEILEEGYLDDFIEAELTAKSSK
jgi:peptide chain release factor 2